MLEYKFNVMKELKKRGYTAGIMRKKKILSESTMQRLRHDQPVGLEALYRICLMLDCSLDDLLDVVPDPDELIKLENARVWGNF